MWPVHRKIPACRTHPVNNNSKLSLNDPNHWPYYLTILSQLPSKSRVNDFFAYFPVFGLIIIDLGVINQKNQDPDDDPRPSLTLRMKTEGAENPEKTKRNEGSDDEMALQPNRSRCTILWPPLPESLKSRRKKRPDFWRSLERTLYKWPAQQKRCRKTMKSRSEPVVWLWSNWQKSVTTSRKEKLMLCTVWKNGEIQKSRKMVFQAGRPKRPQKAY